MGHTRESKSNILARARRIRGQVEAIERALEQENECADVLQLIAATRGAITSLMNEVLEGHIRHHVLSPKAAAAERRGADELVAIVRSYFK